MAGIYIHIPFCRRACHYCNFHFSTSLQLQNDFIAALLEEIRIRKNYLGDEPVNTVYFGGGTPSLLDTPDLSRILDRLANTFSISPGAEVTLEANPDDITREKLAAWKKCGVNRLSIGVQSFFDEDLKWMNRAHDAGQAVGCIDLAQQEGFDNLSVDLIYGGPTLPDENWIKNLEMATALGIPHLSCYALTVEPGTALEHMTRKKKVKEVTSEDQARQFEIMTGFLAKKGYEHYEISNFSLPGKRSRHNSAYWSGEKYLGLGPSAHSYNGVARQWNVANNALYIKGLSGVDTRGKVEDSRDERTENRDKVEDRRGQAGGADGAVPYEIEILTPVQRFNEYIMTSLRTIEGVDVDKVAIEFGEERANRLLLNAAPFAKKQLVRVSDHSLVLTEQGKLFADGIAADLFEEEDQTSTASIFLNASRG